MLHKKGWPLDFYIDPVDAVLQPKAPLLTALDPTVEGACESRVLYGDPVVKPTPVKVAPNGSLPGFPSRQLDVVPHSPTE